MARHTTTTTTAPNYNAGYPATAPTKRMSILNRLKFSPLLYRILRTLQFLSALSSLVVFSIRVRKLLNLYKSLSTATGAVEGILAAAVAYTLAITIITLLLRRTGAPSFLRWLLIALDIAFVAAFIAVAVLTRNGGKAGPCYGERKRIAKANGYRNDPGCQLPLGTFVTAIVSTILHALTAVFHEVRDHHAERKMRKEHDKEWDNTNDHITQHVNGDHLDHNNPIAVNSTHQHGRGGVV